MTKPWRTLCLALLALQLAGCTAQGGGSAANGSPREPLPPASATASSPAGAVVTEAPSATAAPPSPVPAEETPIQTPLYEMNGVYRFVPMDDRAPAQAVLLTFDDGPKDEAVLTQLLDVLDEHEAKAIFFVNGYRVKQNPELLALIHERGQAIGNHSYDHINLRNESAETVEKQIGDVQSMVEELIGEKPLFFRPPYGAGNDNVRSTAKNHGMLYMTWSNGSLDWESSSKNNPDAVVSNVLEQLHPGANILMHELPWTADALDPLLTELEKRNYGFIDPGTIFTE